MSKYSRLPLREVIENMHANGYVMWSHFGYRCPGQVQEAARIVS